MRGRRGGLFGLSRFLRRGFLLLRFGDGILLCLGGCRRLNGCRFSGLGRALRRRRYHCALDRLLRNCPAARLVYLLRVCGERYIADKRNVFKPLTRFVRRHKIHNFGIKFVLVKIVKVRNCLKHLARFFERREYLYAAHGIHGVGFIEHDRNAPQRRAVTHFFELGEFLLAQHHCGGLRIRSARRLWGSGLLHGRRRLNGCGFSGGRLCRAFLFVGFFGDKRTKLLLHAGNIVLIHAAALTGFQHSLDDVNGRQQHVDNRL